MKKVSHRCDKCMGEAEGRVVGVDAPFELELGYRGCMKARIDLCKVCGDQVLELLGVNLNDAIKQNENEREAGL